MKVLGLNLGRWSGGNPIEDWGIARWCVYYPGIRDLIDLTYRDQAGGCWNRGGVGSGELV